MVSLETYRVEASRRVRSSHPGVVVILLSSYDEAEFADRGKHEFLSRLWAVRKVGFLLEEVRRNGEQAELVAEIKRLGIRHGIVTPYTAYLAEEPEMGRQFMADGDDFVLDGVMPWVTMGLVPSSSA